MPYTPDQQTRYDALIKAGAPQAQAANAVSLIPTNNPAPTTTIPAPQMPVSTLQSNQTPIDVPTAPTTLDAMGNNAGIPAPASIINTALTPTPTGQQNQDILNKKAEIIKNNKGLTELTQTAEADAGVPGMNKIVNDLTTQLQGLNDQATLLQNEAAYTIPNQTQLDSAGRGITAGGLAPITAAKLRENQIKQGAIATQALTVKAALYGAQGNLTLAKDSAEKAAKAQYEAQEQQLDYQDALIAAIKPKLDKEEAAQAAIIEAKLQDRRDQIATAKENKKAIIGWAVAAMTNFPNDKTAQYYAQQALAESNKEQPDLMTAFSLIGKYQADPAQAQKDLDTHLQAQAQLKYTNTNIAKTNADIKKTNAETANVGTGTGGSTSGSISGDVKDILEGRNTMYNIRQTMGRTNQAAAYMQNIRDEIRKVDPNFDFVASDAGGKSVSTSYVQRATAAINAVLPNIDTIVDLSNQVTRIGIKGVDSLLQKGAAQIGDKKVSNFRQAQKLIADEIGVALGAGTVSDMKLQLGFDVTDPTVTPEVFASNMALVKEFINNRKDALEGLRYKSSTVGGGSNNITKSGMPFDYEQAKSAGYTDQEIRDYLNSH